MEKQEIFDKFTDFIKQCKVYPEILEKHGALDITSGFADKLDSIKDPFERSIVCVHCVDLLDMKKTEEVLELRNRHQNLLQSIFRYNRGTKENKVELFIEARTYFDKYIAEFEVA
jgi:hypothetical protein